MVNPFAVACQKAIAEQARRDDLAVREMLGQWVSGLEPSIAYGPNFRLLGLTAADFPVGAEAPIVVDPPSWYASSVDELSKWPSEYRLA